MSLPSSITRDLPEVLRLADVIRATGLRRSSIYERVAAGTFPRPIQLSERAVGWLAGEVADWVHQRIAERDAAHPPARKSDPAPEQASA